MSICYTIQGIGVALTRQNITKGGKRNGIIKRMSCELAVDGVGYRRGGENDERNDGAEVCGKPRLGDEDRGNADGNHKHSHNCQFVRKIHL